MARSLARQLWPRPGMASASSGSVVLLLRSGLRGPPSRSHLGNVAFEEEPEFGPAFMTFQNTDACPLPHGTGSDSEGTGNMVDAQQTISRCGTQVGTRRHANSPWPGQSTES